MIQEDLKEGPAFEQRVKAGWACYNKWSHILESKASVAVRVKFWERTVLHSLLWGLQTTRAQDIGNTLNNLLSCQKCMFRRMFKRKRMTGESWLDWHKRSFRHAGELIMEYNSNVLDKLQDLKRSWAGHCVRFGLGPKEQHLVKSLLFWRPYSWWSWQQTFNGLTEFPVLHAPQQGVPKRWDTQFSSNYPHVFASQI